MENNGIVRKVDCSDWEIRICCNYKPTRNPWLENNEYPIPKVDDLLFTLNGNKYFSVIDLTGAYLQLKLDKESQE